MRHKLAITACSLWLLVLASPVLAQDTGTISGTVADGTGAVIPGAEVTATNDVTGEDTTALTGGVGDYTLTLPAGNYTLSVTMPGFETGVAPGVALAAGGVATQDFALELGALTTNIVVGTRAEPRSVTESPVPVDVIPTQEFIAQGTTDLADQLRNVVPSFNINIQPISDAATIVRPANLRNLAPDHTLVLVNGKRRHRAAVITWLGNGIADGSQGPDISVIPSIAIRQAEVLRDGAAAQYGSDAIAGVMNFELKNASSGGSVEFRTGAYLDQNTGDPSTCGASTIGDIKHSCNGIRGHGRAMTVAGNVGLPWGDNGFVNISAEYGDSNPTNRAIQRDDAIGIIGAGNTNLRNTAQVWGSARLDDDVKLFGNFGYQINDTLQFYGHTNLATRTVTGGFYFRNPHTRPGVFRGLRLNPDTLLPVYDEDGNLTNFPDPDESDDRNRVVYDSSGNDVSMPGEGGIRSLLVGDRVWAQMAPEGRTPPEGRLPGEGGCSVIPIIRNEPDPAALAAVEADPNCFTLFSRFPGGFTPQFGGDYQDYSWVSGVRGFTAGGFTWDASINIGSSEVDQFIFDTVNASVGYDTPTSFRPGTYRQQDLNFNFDTTYRINEFIHFASGVEWRREQFTIGAGDPASWDIGPYAAQGFSSGSNGFNGYRADTTAGEWSRANFAWYGDVEFENPDGYWTLGTAVRVERFDDFGSTVNGKVTFRGIISDAVSVRGAVSSGFRAPTPGQQNAFNVTTAFIGGELTNQGVVPSTSAVAVARGGAQIQPETSINWSGGVVVEDGPFTFTADYFRIDIKDRVALAQEIKLSEDEIVTLLAEGIPEARNFPVFRFFLNDFSTTTQGVDVISTLAAGSTTFSAVFNYTDTQLKNIESSVIDDFRIFTLESGLPNTRWNFTTNHDGGSWTLMGRLSFYGKYWDSEDGRNAADLSASDLEGTGLAVVPSSTAYPNYGGRALVDVELGIPLGERVTLSLGGENVFNTYPEVNSYGALTVGNRYGQFSPFGFNGAFYYTRLNYTWGFDF